MQDTQRMEPTIEEEFSTLILDILIGIMEDSSHAATEDAVQVLIDTIITYEKKVNVPYLEISVTMLLQYVYYNLIDKTKMNEHQKSAVSFIIYANIKEEIRKMKETFEETEMTGENLGMTKETIKSLMNGMKYLLASSTGPYMQEPMEDPIVKSKYTESRVHFNIEI